MSGHPPMSVSADLTFAVGRDTYRLHGQGPRLVLDAASVGALLRLRRELGEGAGAVLEQAGVEVEVRAGGRAVGRYDPVSRSVRLRPLSVVRSWIGGLFGA